MWKGEKRVAMAAVSFALVGCLALTGCDSGNDGDAATSDTGSEPAAEQQAEAPQSDYQVSIDSAQRVTDYEGKPALAVSYTWTNNSEDTTSFAVALYAQCFQNGVELQNAVVTGIDTNSYMSDVQPGGSTQVTQCYELSDESPVDVQVTELISFDDTPLAETTFDLATL